MNGLRIFAVCCAVLSSVSVSFAEDLQQNMDTFYAGVSDIIERDMDAPDECVAAVDRYYQEHRDFIGRMRQETAKGLKAMEQYVASSGELTDEKLIAMSEEMERKGAKPREASPVMERYSKLLGEFTLKHPGHGVRIATKAMEFMPQQGVPGNLPAEEQVTE